MNNDNRILMMKKHITLFILLALLFSTTGCTDGHTHKWKEANYQSPSICEECGATRGLPLTADFERYGIKAEMKPETDYTLTTLCAEENVETTATVRISSVATFGSDDTHEARNGYQWVVVKMTINAGDSNSNAYGFTYNYLTADYYDTEKFETSYQYSDKKNNVFTVNYNGVDYADCICSVQTVSGEWILDRTDDIYRKTITITWNLQIPVGYDGIVIGVHSSAIIDDGKLLKDYYRPEGFLLFRVEA